jgi:hypothetical protein
MRRLVGGALGWIEDNELVRPILGGLVVTALLAGFVFVRAVAPEGDRGAAVAPSSAPSPAVPDVAPRTTEHENLLGGFAFAYPTSWQIIESGARTFLESPDGRLVLGFGRAHGASLEAGADRTIEEIVEGWRDHELTGTTHEVIAGSRSLLVGGTIAEGERALRFLAITVRARPRNFAISILAPRGADPMRVLPRIEEIVASFQMLGAAEGTPA